MYDKGLHEFAEKLRLNVLKIIAFLWILYFYFCLNPMVTALWSLLCKIKTSVPILFFWKQLGSRLAQDEWNIMKHLFEDSFSEKNRFHDSTVVEVDKWKLNNLTIALSCNCIDFTSGALSKQFDFLRRFWLKHSVSINEQTSATIPFSKPSEKCIRPSK